MDAEILDLLLKFPLSLEREGAKFSSACLAWLPLTCCPLRRCVPVAEIKDGGVLQGQKVLFPSVFACLWLNHVKKTPQSSLTEERVGEELHRLPWQLLKSFTQSCHSSAFSAVATFKAE